MVVPTEVWLRNPSLYVRECVEVGACWIAWDRGYLVKRRIDPTRFGNLYYPASVAYRMLLIGDQGTAEVRRGRPASNPVAVYPTWIYGHDTIARLEDLLANPVGEDRDACDEPLPADERPVFGQEHRVVISDTPSAGTAVGVKFYGLLREMQADYPDAIMHVHGLYSYRVAFGNGYRSVDVEPRTLASKGKVTLPSGKECTYEAAADAPHWVAAVGMRPSELAVPRNRCIYNIRTAMWAAEHFMDNHRFRVRGKVEVDPADPDPAPPSTNGVMGRRAAPMVGDKFDCDTCSLSATCKFYRAGMVCSLPDSDGSKLAKHFKTRDSAQIIEGLGALMEQQLERLDEGRSTERTEGGLNPEVTKIIDGLFDKGVKLAKLVDPALNRPGVSVGVQINGQGAIAAPPSATPQELAAHAVAALEARGYSRSEMTPELIEAVMTGMPVPVRRAAIEARASDD